MARRIEKLQVNFTPNNETIEHVTADVLMTQLMVTVAIVGLRTGKFSKDSVIITEEEE